MLELILVVILLAVCAAVAWFIGIVCALWSIRERHPRAFAEMVAERKRGGNDALSS